MALYRNERLGAGILAEFVIIARHGFATDCASAILSDYSISDCNFSEGTQDFDLLVAHGSCVKVAGRLHGYQCKQLQHVVLYHVAQCATVVIIADARFQTDSLSDSDLDVVNMRCIPDRFEHEVRKPQREQVLDRLLA